MAWQQILNGGEATNFACCGVDHDGKLLLGGYGSGQICAVPDGSLEATDTGEAIMAMCEFKGSVYATSENNDADGTTRVLRRTGQGDWVPINIPGYAAYFMCVWGDKLVITTSPDGRPTYEYIDVWISDDGSSFFRIDRIQAWAWVPVSFNGDLYLLGHSGPANGPGASLGMKWNGAAFQTVAELTGLTADWQCAKEVTYNNQPYLFLGRGGWTIGGLVSTLSDIYRYDGGTITHLQKFNGYAELSAITSISGTVYVAAASGFKYGTYAYHTPGNSQVWYSSDNGASWTLSNTFTMPQLYALIPSTGGLIAAGGRGGRMEAYISGEAKVMTEIVPPTDVTISAYQYDVGSLVVLWTPSETQGVRYYQTQVSYYTAGATQGKWITLTNVDRTSPYPDLGTTICVFKPTRVNVPVRARVRSVIIQALPGASKQGLTNRLYSDWSTISPDYRIYPTYALTAPSYLTAAHGTYAGEVVLTWPACTENNLAVTYLEYANLADGIIRKITSVSGAVTTYTFDATAAGATYKFYAYYGVANTTIESPRTSSAGIIIPAGLSAPLGVSCAFTSPTSALLYWQDQAEGEAVYVVDRWLSTTGTWAKIAELPAGTTSLTDSSISLNVQVKYRVQARSGSIVSTTVESNAIPLAPSNFSIQLSSYDPVTKDAVIQINQNWTKYSDFPAFMVVERSEDGTSYALVQTLLPDAITTFEVTTTLPQERDYFFRLYVTNGAGVVLSNVLPISSLPALYTTPNPPVYDAGTAANKTLIWGPAGAGETDFAVTGLVRYDGYLYAASATMVGLLDKEPTYAKVSMMPVGDEWFGEKTVYSVELDASTHRDGVVSVGMRNDYKQPAFDAGKDVAIHKTGRTGYKRTGKEFEVTFTWTSGIPKSLKIWGARIWLKLTGRAGLNTIPYFYGKGGYTTSSSTHYRKGVK